MTDKSNKEQRNSLLAIFFLAILAVMLIPMPPLMLDAMLCLNITVSLLILMAVLNSNRPVEFSTFPSVLLFTALFRLALNVSSTRLILLEGDAGSVIRTFGSFVVGGNPVVGIVIFLVLVVTPSVIPACCPVAKTSTPWIPRPSPLALPSQQRRVWWTN